MLKWISEYFKYCIWKLENPKCDTVGGVGTEWEWAGGYPQGRGALLRYSYHCVCVHYCAGIKLGSVLCLDPRCGGSWHLINRYCAKMSSDCVKWLIGTVGINEGFQRLQMFTQLSLKCSYLEYQVCSKHILTISGPCHLSANITWCRYWAGQCYVSATLENRKYVQR